MPGIWTLWGNQEYDLRERFKELKSSLLGADPPQEAVYVFEVADLLKDQAGKGTQDLVQAAQTVSFFSSEVLILLKGIEKIQKKSSPGKAIEMELERINLVKGEHEGQEAWLDQDSLTVAQASHFHIRASQIIEEVYPLAPRHFYLKLHPAWVGRQVWRQKDQGWEGFPIEEFLQSRSKRRLSFYPPSEILEPPALGDHKLVSTLIHLMEDNAPGVSLVFWAQVKNLREIHPDLAKILKSKGKEIKGEVTYDDYRPTGWVVNKAKSLGYLMRPRVAGLLIEVAGNELAVLAQELAKLALRLPQGGEITEAEVLAWASPSSRFSVFLVAEHLARRDLAQSLKSLEQVLDEKRVEPAGLLALIAAQFRRLLRVSWMLQAGASPKEIAQALKLHPWLTEKVIALTRNFSTLELEALLVFLSQQDQPIKQAPKEALIFFENFAFLLCRRAFAGSC